MQNYNLPENLDSQESAREILNRAPKVLYELESNLYAAKEALKFTEAKVTLDEREQKQSVIKALIETNKDVAVVRNEVKKWQTLLTLWEEANANAKYFYKYYNP